MNQFWYIIQTKPAGEDHVRQRCLKAGIEVFLPRVKKVVQRKQHSALRVTSLFPSYLFVHTNLEHGSTYHNLRFTRGVRRILGVGSKPIPVDDSVVDVIRERVDHNEVLVEQIVYKTGEKVRVIKGPLTDLIGILEKPVSSEGRVRVLLHAYEKSIRAELSCSDIESA